MNERTYTIGELKTLISESASEFKAKIGDGVANKNKKENEDTYKKVQKDVESLDGGGKETSKKKDIADKEDGNKTTLDYGMDANCGDDFKDKIKAQAEGYTSTIEKNNGIEKIGEFNDKIYKQFKKAGDEMAKNKVIAKKSGLTARELPDSAFEKGSLYKESKKIAVLNFKNTTFLNESHMISRIPDDYKIEGKRFKVKDANENEFIVEWREGEANILSYENNKLLNESINKFHKLSEYNSKTQTTKSSNKNRFDENNEFSRILNKIRTLNDNN